MTTDVIKEKRSINIMTWLIVLVAIGAIGYYFLSGGTIA
jgi:hypothetical protein